MKIIFVFLFYFPSIGFSYSFGRYSDVTFNNQAVNRARVHAIQVVTLARDKTKNADRNYIYGIIPTRLTAARIILDHGPGTIIVNGQRVPIENVTAYARYPNLFLAPGFYENWLRDELNTFKLNFIAHIFIHEAVHLSGIKDECIDAELTLAAFQLSATDYPGDAYDMMCGLISDGKIRTLPD